MATQITHTVDYDKLTLTSSYTDESNQTFSYEKRFKDTAEMEDTLEEAKRRASDYLLRTADNHTDKKSNRAKTIYEDENNQISAFVAEENPTDMGFTLGPLSVSLPLDENHNWDKTIRFINPKRQKGQKFSILAGFGTKHGFYGVGRVRKHATEDTTPQEKASSECPSDSKNEK